MTWTYGDQRASHPLPLAVSSRAAVGQPVRAGDVLASGSVLANGIRVDGARRLGVAPADLARVMRVRVGSEVEGGAILARTGRRFARAVSAPVDGRVLHVRSDGDIELAPVVGRWAVRSVLDGVVTRSSDAEVVVEGAAWALRGIAAYGPDAVGELARVSDASEELVPSRIDVRQQGRILIAGGRAGAEAIARGHACGAAAVVAATVPASGLRMLFGDDVSAHGASGPVDAPTVLCLAGFGTGALPDAVFAPFRALDGVRAAVHTASAALFAFAPETAFAPAAAPPLELAADWGSVRAAAV